MTAEEVRDLIHDLLTWRQAQGPAANGQNITAIRPVEDSGIAVTFGDGTTALICAGVSGTEGGQK